MTPTAPDAVPATGPGAVPAIGPGAAVPALRLEPWTGPIAEDDPDARFKEEIAEYGRLDPTVTLDGLSDYLGVPPGALARAVLARWAAEGSAALMELGPSTVTRLHRIVRDAEADGSDAARLAAYHRLAGMLGWLAAPLEEGSPEEG